jgi:crotonobetainyl-CoA:carnitine CoA-transferase CaiB-like acyl-CoA transferase
MNKDYFNYVNELFDQSKQSEKPEVFKGLRVLDFTHIIFGSIIAKWFSLFGAEVIKIEEPYEGDAWRSASYWAKYWKGSSPFFQCLHWNKRFVGIDLKTQKGKDLALELANKADVVVENFRAGLMEAWGLGYTTISKTNPKVIYVSCSGYGQWGPLRFFPSWDLIAQSMAGVALLTGFDEKQTYKLPDYYGDFQPGIFGVMGTLSALYNREKTGKGQFIDVSQVEVLLRMMHHWSYMDLTGEDLKSSGNIDPSMAPSGIFKTQDEKFISIAIATDEQFKALSEAMDKIELCEDSRFQDTFERLKPDNATAIHNIVDGWAGQKLLSDIITLAQTFGFPAAEVKNDFQIANDEWRRERGSVIEFEDEMYGKGEWPGAPIMLEKTPAQFKSLQRPIGYHNRYVFQNDLNLSKEEIRVLEKKHVIGCWGNSIGHRPPTYYNINDDPVFNFDKDNKK